MGVVKVRKNKHKKNNNAGQIYITKDSLVKGKSRNRPLHLVSQLSVQPPFHHSLPQVNLANQLLLKPRGNWGKSRWQGKRVIHQERSQKVLPQGWWSAVGFCLIILYGTLDRILGKHTAMQFDGRQAELLCNFSILDSASILQGHSTDELGEVAA